MHFMCRFFFFMEPYEYLNQESVLEKTGWFRASRALHCLVLAPCFTGSDST